MQDKFNDSIKNKLQKFTLQPSDAVWMEVEKTLIAKQRKKRFVFWWITGAFLFVGLFVANYCFFIGTNNNQKNIVVNKQEQTINQTKTLQNQINTTTIEKSANKNIHLQQAEINKNVQLQNERFVLNNKRLNEKQVILKSKINAENIGVVHKSDENFERKETLISTIYNEQSTNNLTDENKGFEKAHTILRPLELVEAKTPILLKGEIYNPTNAKITKKKKGYLTYYVGAGLVEASTFPESPKQLSNLTIPPIGIGSSGGGSSNSNSLNKLNTPSVGFNIIAGLAYNKPLSKRVTWSNAFLYQFTTNTQSANADTAIAQNRNAFISGSNMSIVNSMHTIGVETSMQYLINKNAKKPLYAVVGLQMQYALANTWLFTDYSKQIFYYNSNNANSVFASAIVGVKYNAFKTASIQMNWQPYFTPIHKGTNNNQLQIFQLRVLKNLKK